MADRYELWTRVRPSPTWRIVGPDVEFHGSAPRGYLTLPPIEIRDPSGAVVASLGGERRFVPRRHVLTTSDGAVLATFDTHVVAGVIESRPIHVTDADGSEICTLVPAEAELTGLGKRLASVLSDGGYGVVCGAKEVGQLGIPPAASSSEGIRRRLATLSRQAGERLRGEISEHLAAVLVLEREFGAPVAAGLLLYKFSVLDPSRVPES